MSEKLLVLTALKREFDGYDRWSRENVQEVNFQKEILLSEEYMKNSNGYEKYYDIEIREADQQESEKFIESLYKKIASTKIDVKHTEQKIKSLNELLDALDTDIGRANSYLFSRI